jgi:molybdenum cofactor cytidylyltransferase
MWQHAARELRRRTKVPLQDRLHVVILAAGQARRLGRDKATLRWGRTALIRHVLEQFPADLVDRRVVVASARNESRVRRAVTEAVQVVVNRDPSSEMITSVQLGIQALGKVAGAVCIHPVDVFAISAELVTLLHNAWRAAPAAIHLPEVGGKGAHPLLVPARFLSAIGGIPPGRGLNHLLREQASEVVRHRWHDERLLVDLDTWEEYAQYRPRVASARKGRRQSRKP